jgi:hypothetical protein
MELTQCCEVDELHNGTSFPHFNIRDLAFIHSFIGHLQLLHLQPGFRVILFVMQACPVIGTSTHESDLSSKEASYIYSSHRFA